MWRVKLLTEGREFSALIRDVQVHVGFAEFSAMGGEFARSFPTNERVEMTLVLEGASAQEFYAALSEKPGAADAFVLDPLRKIDV